MDIGAQITSRLYWLAALVAALIDIAFVALLAWRVKPNRFRQVKWPLAGVAGIFWLALWGGMMWNPFTWESCYQYVFPAWMRPVWPPVFGLLSGGFALLFWWLAQRPPGNPVLYLILLGGLESFPGHLRAIGLGILDSPLLKNVSAASALTFGFFEFGFYWCIILTLASLINWGWGHRHTRHSK